MNAPVKLTLDDLHKQRADLLKKRDGIAEARESDGVTIVTILPITHAAPADPKAAIEIPLPVKSISVLTTRAHGSASPKAMNSCGPAMAEKSAEDGQL